MPKAVINLGPGSALGSHGSAGLGAAFGSAAVVPVVTFTAAVNPDGSAQKDTRK